MNLDPETVEDEELARKDPEAYVSKLAEEEYEVVGELDEKYFPMISDMAEMDHDLEKSVAAMVAHSGRGTQAEVADEFGIKKNSLQYHAKLMGLNGYHHSDNEVEKLKSLIPEDQEDYVDRFLDEEVWAKPQEMVAAIHKEVMGKESEEVASYFDIDPESVDFALEMKDEYDEADRKEEAAREELENLGVDPDELDAF